MIYSPIMPGKERLISETYCAIPLVVKDGQPEFIGLQTRGDRTYRVFKDRSLIGAGHFTSSLVTDLLLADMDIDLILIQRGY